MNRISIKTCMGVRWVETHRIVHFEAFGNYCYVFLADEPRLFSTAPLKHYQDVLHGKGFYRIHHKIMINTDRELELKHNNKQWYVILPCKTELPVAARKKNDFFNYMNMNG